MLTEQSKTPSVYLFPAGHNCSLSGESTPRSTASPDHCVFHSSHYTWDYQSHFVPAKLTGKPFKLMATSSLHLITRKPVFLVAITSANRASELCLFHAHLPYFIFHSDKVVFQPDQSFFPKVVTPFHLAQTTTSTVFPPSFFGGERNPIFFRSLQGPGQN